MSAFFCDELSELRISTYWRLLSQKCTIQEWEYACTQAMLREEFHKIPLPAALLDYIREYRSSRRSRQREERPDGSHTTAQLLQLREELHPSEEVKRLIESIWPDGESR